MKFKKIMTFLCIYYTLYIIIYTFYEKNQFEATFTFKLHVK